MGGWEYGWCLEFLIRQTTRFLQWRIAKVSTKFALEVFPNIWLNNILQEYGKYKTSLERTLSSPEEQSLEKKLGVKKQRLGLRIDREIGEIHGC